MESILLEDNQHWINQNIYNNYIHRDVLEIANMYIETNEIIALIGARRVGKSTLAKLMIKEILKTTNSKNIFFINLEKPEFIPYKHDATYLNKIYDDYIKLAQPNLDEKIYFFIDEIQIFQNWEVFVKSKYENSNIKFIITGSNSSLLTSNYATVLTGRVLKLEIYSFSFREFLTYKEIPYATQLEKISNKIEIKRAIDEYLKWGGYFSVISASSDIVKKEHLKNIAEDIILKDIVPRYKIKNSQEIKDLFYYVVSNATTILNYTSLSKKLNIDSKMVKEYINYFEDNFLITTIPMYHTKLTAQIKSAKKLYLTDNGFLNLGINRTKNIGISLENLVFDTIYQNDDKVTYMKDKYEVDFYSNNTLYQVSYDIEDDKTKKRELNSFKYFKNNNDKCKLITYDINDKIDDIEVVSLDKFLLSNKENYE